MQRGKLLGPVISRGCIYRSGAPRAGHAFLTRGCQRRRRAARRLARVARRRAPHVPRPAPRAPGGRQGRKWRWRPVMFVDKGNHTVSHIWCSDLPVVVGLSPAGRVSHPPPHRASLLVDCCAAAPHRGPPRKQRALSSTAEAPARPLLSLLAAIARSVAALCCVLGDSTPGSRCAVLARKPDTLDRAGF